MKLIFATHNSHKLSELKQLIPDREILGLEETGYRQEIAETGITLEENALIKARAIHQHYGAACLADDTGLEVDALQGAPGVYSARYAGPNAEDGENVEKLLKAIPAEADRSARFRTVIAYLNEAGEEQIFHGEVEGKITAVPHGEGGFGYDPVFQPLGYDKTFAEMTAEQKNALSHRGRAVHSFVDFMLLQDKKS